MAPLGPGHSHNRPPAKRAAAGGPGGAAAAAGAVNCVCGEPAALRTVSKEGANKGRQFHTCSKPQGQGCAQGFAPLREGEGYMFEGAFESAG
jgi:hypothetical protein